LEVTATAVKELRDKTNAGMMDCKKALLDTHGDMEKAIDLLRQKGLAKALKRAGKETSEGMVHSYIHAGGRLGVLLEVNCETDFAAKSEDFAEFVKNVAMHVAASNPLGVQREDIPPDILQRERDIYLAQARETGKPENILEKMVDGKMRKFFEESVLLEQRYIKDTDKTIQDYLNELVAKIGEKIIIRRYARFQLGGE
jgi:elongation factor Ts